MLRTAALPLAAGLIALACAGSAAADPRSDLHAAFQKNLAAKSYRATMTDLATGRQVSTVDFQAPDRFRVSVAGGPTSIIAGGFMYMDIDGRSMKVPLPAGMMDNYRSDSAWRKLQKDTLIQAAGAGTVGAEPARKYHWISSGKDASVGDVWVSLKSGRVIQVETSAKAGDKSASIRVRYSDFDSPAIRVTPPKQ